MHRPRALVPLGTIRDGGPALSWGFRPHGASRARFDHLLRDLHHRPSERLAAPERPRAFLYEAFSSRRSAPLSEDPALLAFPRRLRRAPRWSGRTRPTAGLDSRRRARSAVDPCGPTRRCLPEIHPSRALSPPDLARAFSSPRTLPHHALGWIDVPTRLRLEVLRHGRPGVAPLGAAGSPGVPHLATVAAPLRPPRGTGVWFRRPAPAVAPARTGLFAPSCTARPRLASRPGTAVLR
jgi:hypothetical protein